MTRYWRQAAGTLGVTVTAVLAAPVLLLWPGAAVADEASIVGAGGAIHPMAGHALVRMRDAEVKVQVFDATPANRRRLLGADALPGTADDAPLAHVECRFTLQNTGGAAAVRMGFPEDRTVGSDDEGRPLKGPFDGFLSFSSWVDGKPWETTCSEWQPTDVRGFSLRRWRMKSVPFSAGQTRVVRDEYVTALGYAGGSADWFSYTLATGSSWKGPIGRERVTLDLSGLGAWQLVDAAPRAGLLAPRADQVVWEWRDLEPTGETAEVCAQFIRGQYALVTHQMHSWLGLRYDQVRHDGGGVMVPGDAVLGQYGEDEVLWDPQTKHLVSHSGDTGRGAVLTAGSKTVLLRGKPVRLPTAPYLAATPPGYQNSDLMGDSGETLFVPLESTVKALGGKLYRLYGNGPLCLSFPRAPAPAVAKVKTKSSTGEPVPPVWPPPPEVSITSLGDINGDGKVETAKTIISESADTRWTTVKILSGRRVILSIDNLAGDTADGYKPVGRQIAVWQGDWESESSKWNPHCYDFIWYAWDAKRGRYVQAREGFTKQSYDYEDAEATMPRLATGRGDELVLSRGASFAQDALQQARTKYGNKECRSIGCPPRRLFEQDARAFVVNYRGERDVAHLKGRIVVIYRRDGSTQVGRWAQDITP